MTEKVTRIYRSLAEGGAAAGRMFKAMAEQFDRNHRILSVTCFCGAATTDELLRQEAEFGGVLGDIFPETEIPLFTLIAQRPLSNSLAAEVTYLRSDGCKITRHKDYLTLDSDADIELITKGIRIPKEGDAEVLSKAVFSRISEILSAEGFRPSDILRQWNYIENITGVSNGRQNYQMFNDARSDFYSTDEWPGGYPAATGIGCDAGGITVSVYAAKKKGAAICKKADSSTEAASPGCANLEQSLDTAPLDNPIQVPAHSYSNKVLAAGNRSKSSTPKFERARRVGKTVYMSGTAAIKGENSELSDNAEVQAMTVAEVVQSLVSPKNIAPWCSGFKFETLRVYVKNPSDLSLIEPVLTRQFRGIPTHFLKAGICRPELLLEIEGIGLAVGTD